MIRFSVRKFPVSKDLDEAAGIPWGCSVEPLVNFPKECNIGENSSVLARCHNCYSYINCFTTVNKTHWQCLLCQADNENIARYANAAEVPELKHTTLEFNISPEAEDNPICQDPPILPVYIAVVDVTGTPDFIKLVQESLRAVVKNLNPDSLFGLVVFDERIGVYNLYCAKPHIRHVRISNGSCPISLEEMIQHEDAFVHVGKMHREIEAAIDNISIVAAQGSNRCTASTLQSLIKFFSAYKGHTQLRARLLTFVSGPCTFGAESLYYKREGNFKQGIYKSDTTYNEGVHKRLFQPQSYFYKELASQASIAGVSVDLYVVAKDWVDLCSMRAVCEMTGGRLIHYTDPVECPLPHDCGLLVKLYGNGRGMLRVRTASPFKVVKMRGPCTPDPYTDDVLHAAGLDVNQAFAADFQFYRGAANKFDDQNKPAIVQVTFAYTTAQGQRKLRIQTVKIPTVQYIENLFDTADPEVITKLLVYKSLDSCYRWNINEGRVSVLDTYVYLLSHYNETLPYESHDFDIEFTVYPHLQILPALIYGMFVSPFMSCRPDISLDQLVAFQSKCIAANPEHLALLFYPHLMSFENPSSSPGLSLPLSPVTVKSVEETYILLDAYDTILILRPQEKEPTEIIDNMKELSLNANDNNRVANSDMIERYINEARCTRPVHVKVINSSSPVSLCPYLINDSGAVKITQPGSSYDHYYWKGYNAFYKFINSQLHRLYDPEGESDYEYEDKEKESVRDENVTSITNA